MLWMPNKMHLKILCAQYKNSANTLAKELWKFHIAQTGQDIQVVQNYLVVQVVDVDRRQFKDNTRDITKKFKLKALNST